MNSTSKQTKKPDLKTVASIMENAGKVSETKDLVIIDELRDLLDNLQETEFKELQKSVEEEGIRDPLIIWEEKNAILDGHNRYKISKITGKPFKVVKKSFDDISGAKRWMLRNQLGRRNLTPQRFEYYIGKLYNETKQDANAARVEQGGEPTAKIIGKQFGVSERTVRRAGEVAKGLDKLEQVKGKLAKFNQLEGKGPFTKSEVATIGKASNAAVASRVVKKLEETKAKVAAKQQSDKKASAAVPPATYPVAFVEPNFDAIGFNVSTEPKPPLDKDAIVYMAVADEHMGQALKLFEKWGLAYECSFVFPLSTGYEGVWSKVKHVFLIAGTKGTITGPKADKAASSLMGDSKETATDRMANLIDAYHSDARKLAILNKGRTPNGWSSLAK